MFTDTRSRGDAQGLFHQVSDWPEERIDGDQILFRGGSVLETGLLTESGKTSGSGSGTRRTARRAKSDTGSGTHSARPTDVDEVLNAL